MKYKKYLNRIEIDGLEDFDIKQTLECGQIFRYKIKENKGFVLSKDKKADFEVLGNRLIITTKDVKYFETFFDLKTDYSNIKSELIEHEFLKPAVDFGGGIRILNNDLLEMIVSFIISANNNIKRIKNSIEMLCERFGEKVVDYHAFPTLTQLKMVSVQDFVEMGLGYRAEQLHATLQDLTEEKLQSIKSMPSDTVKNELIKLKGVGPKVANCIMLFGLNITNTFPVDTWINKVYNKINSKEETNRSKIEQEMINKFQSLSGYAQQYLFYFFRENNIKL